MKATRIAFSGEHRLQCYRSRQLAETGFDVDINIRARTRSRWSWQQLEARRLSFPQIKLYRVV